MVRYHKLVLMFNVKWSKQPRYLADMFSEEYSYRTRFASGGNLRVVGEGEVNLTITKQSFRFRATREWNDLPTELKHVDNLRQFKWKLKAWIKENVPIK